MEDYFKSKFTGQQIEDIIEKLNNDDVILLDHEDTEESLNKFWEKFNQLEFDVNIIKKIIIRYSDKSVDTILAKGCVVLYFTVNDVYNIAGKKTIHTNTAIRSGANYKLTINDNKLTVNKEYTSKIIFKLTQGENNNLIITNIEELSNKIIKQHLENNNFKKFISIIDMENDGEDKSTVFNNITRINYLKGYNFSIGDKSDYSEFYIINFLSFTIYGINYFSIIIPVENNELILDDIICNPLT